jgi:hypothetical protein
LVVLGLALVLALGLVAGCAGEGGGGQEEEAAEESISGVFVGQVSGADELVAVIADEPEETGGGRRVRAYVCDGRPEGVVEWFTGQVAGNTINLTSIDEDAEFQAELTNEEATGTRTLDDGEPLDFTAPAAYAGAGLYDVTNNPDGLASGTSTRGEEYEAVHLDGGLVDNTITLLDGEQLNYRTQALVERSGEPARYFLIIAPNGNLEYGRSPATDEGGRVTGFKSEFYAQAR